MLHWNWNRCWAGFLGVVFALHVLPNVHGEAEEESGAATILPVAPRGFYDIRSPQAAALLKTYPNVVILDIRTPKEFKAGHLRGAKNLDYFADDFEAKLDALSKTKTYLVHCASGGRSGKALKVLKRKKFAAVYHLKDGYKGWVAAKFPVIRD